MSAIPEGPPGPRRRADGPAAIVVNPPVEVSLTSDLMDRFVKGGHAVITGVVATRADDSQFLSPGFFPVIRRILVLFRNRLMARF
jgi:hypothetical protein